MSSGWSQEAHDARLANGNSTLDRWNVESVMARIEEYPEIIAAVAALPDRLVLDLAGAREQIARAIHSVDVELNRVAWDALQPGYRRDYLAAADAVIVALASQERGE